MTVGERAKERNREWDGGKDMGLLRTGSGKHSGNDIRETNVALPIQMETYKL